MNLSTLPEELKKSTRWVTWRLEDFEERTRCKVPKQAKNPGRNAKATDPDTWSTMEEALAALPSMSAFPKYVDDLNPFGVGLVIGAPYIGVDLDKCYDPETGVVDDWAKAVIKQLPKTYTELSPSRKGFHLWYRCTNHGGLDDGIRTEKAEVYARKRYFTMTGEHVVSTLTTITELDLAGAQAIFKLVDSLRPQKPSHSDVKPAQSSPRLAELMSRADFPDLSAAVQSLLTKLAIEHLCDVQKVEDQFLTSELYKSTHWKEKWARLRESELSRAVANARENLSKRLGRQRAPADQLTKQAKRIKFSELEARELNWLWPERVPAGILTIFAGNPGVGKSLLALDLIGRGSNGSAFLDGKPSLGRFKSLILSMEDDRETIMVPRLMAIGADLSMIEALDMVEFTDDTGEVKDTRLLNLESDLDQICSILKEDPEFKLVVIDPLSNYMGGKSMYRDQEVREVLMPVVQLAQDTGVAVVVIMHHSKQTGRTALEKVGASLGGVGTARMGWAFLKVEENRHQMLLMKQNLGRFNGIEYCTEEASVEIKGKATGQAKMVYLGLATQDSDNVIAAQEDPEARIENNCNNLIKKLLPPGKEAPASLFLDEAKKEGLAERTLKRARQELGIITTRKNGAWYWKWPDDGPKTKVADDEGLF